MIVHVFDWFSALKERKVGEKCFEQDASVATFVATFAKILNTAVLMDWT